MSREQIIRFPSSDGLTLEGVLTEPAGQAAGLSLLVHGGGANRDEGGVYVRLAARLAQEGIASFRFDLRCHGQSEGRPEELTLRGVLSDIAAAAETVRSRLALPSLHIVAASFGGGLSAMYATENQDHVECLVLLNPLLDYKKRLLEESPFWADGALTPEAERLLVSQGWLPFRDAFVMNRVFIRELSELKPCDAMRSLAIPVLTIHGTEDSVVSYEIARAHAKPNPHSDFISIPGADHGFAFPGDGRFEHPQTRVWQDAVIGHAVEWIASHNK